MADLTNEQGVAENSDPSVLEESNAYWGEEPNAEVTQNNELEPTEAIAQPMPENAEGDEQQRYQYWQSRYDQKASEFDNMSQKLAEYEKVAPIAEYIQENPDVLKGVARSLSGDNPQVPSQEKSVELPKKPQRPTKPTNYDATEAYMDQESSSFKYRVELDNYRDNMIDYQEVQEQSRLSAMKAEQDRIAMQRQQYQAEQQQNGMRDSLVNTYGYTPDKAVEFLNYYSSPESITLDNLVQLDKFRNSPSQQDVATQQKVQAMQNQQKRMQIPTPTAVQTGNAEPNYSDEDLFNMGLMANRK